MNSALGGQFEFTLTSDGLRARPQSGEGGVLLPWLWLRDHCRAPHSFNEDTMQRRHTPAELDPNISGVGLEWLAEKDALAVHWNNGEPPGFYPAAFFREVAGSRTPAVGEEFIAPKLWDARALAENGPEADFQSVIGGDEWLMRLAKYGFIVITNTPPNLEGAAAIAKSIGHVRETIFGGLWTLQSGGAAHQDTAYGYEGLGAHTDSTYSPDAPGLQLLLCSELNCQGGESTLVDGFKIADIMRREDSGLYDFLSALQIPAVYIEPGVRLRACRPMFRHDAETGRLAQVSYNCYDRAPFLPLSPESTERFYRGMRRFQELADSAEMTWERRLEPGTALLFDNWRLLHGRRAFSGFRKFCGCYLDRETLQSKLRVAFGKTL